jgi:hypothetical protein
MAFKEAYTMRINAARDARTRPNWSVSLGHDPRARDAVLAQAVTLNRLSLSQARQYAPLLNAPARGTSNERAAEVLGGLAERVRLPS